MLLLHQPIGGFMSVLLAEFKQRVITGLILFMIVVIGTLLLPHTMWMISIWFMISYLLRIELPPLLLPLKTAYTIVISLCYIVLPCMIISFMQQQSVLYLCIIIASFDTGAYIIGKTMGSHFISRISPRKTYEGLIGGIAICLTVMTLLHVTVPTFGPAYSILSIIIITVVSMLGDFFESWLKRQAHCKDSGTLLPGHGGLLDRIDGLLLAVYPYVFIYGATVLYTFSS
jgi:phosphatidate cytidylyltransferase